jgi:hypothetical protein
LGANAFEVNDASGIGLDLGHLLVVHFHVIGYARVEPDDEQIVPGFAGGTRSGLKPMSVRGKNDGRFFEIEGRVSGVWIEGDHAAVAELLEMAVHVARPQSVVLPTGAD